MKPASLTWFRSCMDYLPPDVRELVPDWARRFAVGDEGELYFPAGLVGDEDEILLRAIEDATTVFLGEDEHVYVNADWAARTFPETAEAIENLKRWRNENI